MLGNAKSEIGCWNSTHLFWQTLNLGSHEFSLTIKTLSDIVSNKVIRTLKSCAAWIVLTLMFGLLFTVKNHCVMALWEVCLI